MEMIGTFFVIYLLMSSVLVVWHFLNNLRLAGDYKNHHSLLRAADSIFILALAFLCCLFLSYFLMAVPILTIAIIPLCLASFYSFCRSIKGKIRIEMNDLNALLIINILFVVGWCVGLSVWFTSMWVYAIFGISLSLVVLTYLRDYSIAIGKHSASGKPRQLFKFLSESLLQIIIISNFIASIIGIGNLIFLIYRRSPLEDYWGLTVHL